MNPDFAFTFPSTVQIVQLIDPLIKISNYQSLLGLVGVEGSPSVILHIASQTKLPQSEITIADAFKSAGYSTGLVGELRPFL